jgi:hypothetical protein
MTDLPPIVLPPLLPALPALEHYRQEFPEPPSPCWSQIALAVLRRAEALLSLAKALPAPGYPLEALWGFAFQMERSVGLARSSTPSCVREATTAIVTAVRAFYSWEDIYRRAGPDCAGAVEEYHQTFIFTAAEAVRAARRAQATIAGALGGEDAEFQVRSLRLVGEVWHLVFDGETFDIAAARCKFASQLAKLLSSPGIDLAVTHLADDPSGKIAADVRLGGQRTKDKESLQRAWNRISDIDAAIEETGGSRELEAERAAILAQVGGYEAMSRMRTTVSKHFNNITTQKRQFLEKLGLGMPRLVSHLRAYVKQNGKDYTLGYHPPEDEPTWVVEKS